MKQYMVVYKTDCNETGAVFVDTIAEAEKTRQDIVCGYGWMAQTYEWTKTKTGHEYMLIFE